MALNSKMISLADRSEEERKRIASMGGKACHEKRKQRKKLKEILEICLELQNKKGQTFGELATLGLIQGAIKGDSRNYRLMAQLLGEIDVTNEESEQQNGVLDDLVEALKKVDKK